MRAAASESGEMACLLLPLDECDLLLPNDCVAEVMPWRRVKPAVGLPRWCLGTLGWRGRAVAVVDFGVISGLREQPRVNRRALVIVNRIHVHEGSVFYALACAGLPRILRASEEELQDAGSDAGVVLPPQAALSVLRLGTDVAIVPDLRFLEAEVNRAF